MKNICATRGRLPFFLAGREVTKELAVAYKQKLAEDGYAVKSVNSMLASINSLFAFLGRNDCRVKMIRQQRQIFCSEEKELTKVFVCRITTHFFMK